MQNVQQSPKMAYAGYSTSIIIPIRTQILPTLDTIERAKYPAEPVNAVCWIFDASLLYPAMLIFHFLWVFSDPADIQQSPF